MIAFYHPTNIAIARPVAGLFVGLCTRVICCLLKKKRPDIGA